MTIQMTLIWVRYLNHKRYSIKRISFHELQLVLIVLTNFVLMHICIQLSHDALLKLRMSVFNNHIDYILLQERWRKFRKQYHYCSDQWPPFAIQSFTCNMMDKQRLLRSFQMHIVVLSKNILKFNLTFQCASLFLVLTLAHQLEPQYISR